MKSKYKIFVVLLLTGMTIFAQAPDMSFYIEEYNRTNSTIFQMLDILQAVRDEKLTGIGSFYHDALKVYITRYPNFQHNHEREAIEEAARIILRGLAAEKYTEAAPQVWTLVQYFDIIHPQNEGLIMYEAYVTMGQIGGKEFAHYIAIHLQEFNNSATPDLHTKAEIQRVVPGAVNALEALREPVGVKPVFYASIGWYDADIKAIASQAFPNIVDDPGEIIDEVIRDPFNGPSVKLTAWQEMLRTKASAASKAKVAATALEISYTFIAPSRESQSVLRTMRMSAIDTIRLMGVADDSVYAFIERTYREAFDTPNTDFEIITLIVRTLSTVKTDEAVDLLTEFLRGLHSRRQSGPWGIVERDIMQIVIPALAATGTKSRLSIQLLTVISRSSLYTGAEQIWARNALSALTSN
ncbi:MAG: hypothetical protein FWC19_09835 [Treponema sp.]|nr:hypothetical protein [Treponema sp.]MCL2273086.1 hypothetical protein [Treponema sp.]